MTVGLALPGFRRPGGVRQGGQKAGLPLCVRQLAVSESREPPTLPRLGGFRIPAPIFQPGSFSSLAQALGAQRLCSVSAVLGRPGWVGGGWKKDTRLRPVPSPSTSNSDVDLLLLPQSELGLSSSPSLCTWLVTELSQSAGNRLAGLGAVVTALP